MSAPNTPWRRDPQQPRTIIGANGRTICTAHLSGLPTGEADALAVADMILGAPEMAAELQRLRAALKEIARPLSCGCTPHCRCFEGDRGRYLVEGLRDAALAALGGEIGA